MIGKNYNWHVVYTKSQHERRVFSDTVKRNITAFLPMIKSVKYWCDRKKCIDVPLFPNYIFLKISHKEYVGILEHPSVIGFVKSGKEIPSISEKIIESIKIILNEEMKFDIEKYNYVKGIKVEVLQGPLKGLIGEVVENNNGTYVVICISQIGQAIYVKIEKENLKLFNP